DAPAIALNCDCAFTLIKPAAAVRGNSTQGGAEPRIFEPVADLPRTVLDKKGRSTLIRCEDIAQPCDRSHKTARSRSTVMRVRYRWSENALHAKRAEAIVQRKPRIDCAWHR